MDGAKERVNGVEPITSRAKSSGFPGFPETGAVKGYVADSPAPSPDPDSQAVNVAWHDLPAVVKAGVENWSRLPAVVKAGIVAMLEAAGVSNVD
jgi:hypothetical protein